MAKVKLHPMIMRLQGKIGNVVFRLTHSGTLSATKVADMSNVEWSPAQVEHRLRFKRAVAEAKAALADPVQRAQFEAAAAKAGKRTFDLAVSEHYHKQLPSA
jgi:hypothetical protein